MPASISHLISILYIYALFLFFFFNDTATTEIYTLSLHDALPISTCRKEIPMTTRRLFWAPVAVLGALSLACAGERSTAPPLTSPAFSLQAAPSQFYDQHNLVSDGAVSADLVDPALVNAWGLVASATSPWWVADNGTGL